MLSATAAAEGALPEAEQVELTQRFAARHREIATLGCRFVQRIRLPDSTRTLESSGRMFFKNPGYLRIAFAEPRQEWLLMTPSDVVQQQGIGPISRRTVKTSADRGAYGFLYDLLRGEVEGFERDYHTRMFRGEEEGPVVRVRLTPREAAAGLPRSVETVLDDGGMRLRSVEIEFPDGGGLSLHLEDMETGIDISPGTFAAPAPLPDPSTRRR